jgi:hypothetical protein
MIIVLKVILALIAIADVFSLKFIFDEYNKTTKQNGYDELSIWRRIKFNFTTYFIMSSMLSLFVFLTYFIIVKLSIG